MKYIMLMLLAVSFSFGAKAQEVHNFHTIMECTSINEENLQIICQQSRVSAASDGKVVGKEELNYKQTAYWKKYKRLKKYAWATFGIGVCGTIAGWIGEAGNTAHTNSHWKDDGKAWDVVLVAGIGLTVSSIPLFVFSHKNKRKAKETVEFSFRSSNIHLMLPNGMKQTQHALGVCMNF
ncbi:hypothetical protein [uncultured Bacteroides sp.]|uniref:hypothetical protein n=1 Tax=uncultured Bacteroides sp. TaxID=162156 RepID=UPI002608FD96|nr:hypothetical protein [uncultured Bacteroides sp.]